MVSDWDDPSRKISNVGVRPHAQIRSGLSIVDRIRAANPGWRAPRRSKAPRKRSKIDGIDNEPLHWEVALKRFRETDKAERTLELYRSTSVVVCEMMDKNIFGAAIGVRLGGKESGSQVRCSNFASLRFISAEIWELLERELGYRGPVLLMDLARELRSVDLLMQDTQKRYQRAQQFIAALKKV